MKARAPLRLYARHFPIDRGKDRLLTLVHRLLPLGGEVVTELVPGVRIMLDLDDYVQRSIFYRGVYEAATVRRFRTLLHPGDHVLDVGAHIGQYALLAAAAVGATGAVVAFEPDDELRGRVAANAERNAFTWLRASPVALSDADGEARFAPATGGNRGVGRLAAHGARVVTSRCLDTLWSSLGLARVDLMKLDIEGAELPALRGAESTIGRYRPILVVEASAQNAKPFGYGVAELERWLREHGYRVEHISGSANIVCLPEQA